MQRIDNKLMTSKVLRVTKISLGITTVLFAITMSYQFIKYSFTEDYRHNVDPNFEYLDNGEIEFINYDVQGEDTTALFDLEDYEVENLRLIGLCLSSLSIVYVLLTLMVKGRAHSQLDVLSQQNEVLKKQIENSELKQRLKGITVVESQPTETNQSPEVFSEVRGSNLRSCPKCSTVNEKINSFCSLCGYDFRIDLVANPAASSKKPKYSHGVKTTLIWSTLLSFATLLIYTLKGSITTNIAAQNLIAGILARPMIVIFIAFIISQFFKSQENQIKKFNSISNFIMLLTSTGEFLRWIVILGLY